MQREAATIRHCPFPSHLRAPVTKTNIQGRNINQQPYTTNQISPNLLLVSSSQIKNSHQNTNPPLPHTKTQQNPNHNTVQAPQIIAHHMPSQSCSLTIRMSSQHRKNNLSRSLVGACKVKRQRSAIVLFLRTCARLSQKQTSKVATSISNHNSFNLAQSSPVIIKSNDIPHKHNPPHPPTTLICIQNHNPANTHQIKTLHIFPSDAASPSG